MAKFKDENGQWKELLLPPSGDTTPIGGIIEIPDDMEVPYGWEEVEDETANVEMQNNYTITNNENFVLEKSGNIVTLRCIVKAEDKISADNTDNIMILPEGYRPKKSFYDAVGLGYDNYNGWRVNTIGSIIVNSNGNIVIRANSDTNKISYAFINLMWVV